VKRFADGVTVLVLVLVLIVQVRFCIQDERAPTDLGHYYTAFRNLVLLWDQKGILNWKFVDTPYSLLLAGIGMFVTPSVPLMEVIDGIWLMIMIGGAAVAARALAGPVAGAVAAITVASYPQTHILARTHWIHHPETAALTGALAVWLVAPGIPSWFQAVGIGIFLYLGETIRQTGIPFGLPLAFLVLVGGWMSGARWRLLPAALAMAGGVAWHGPQMMTYISHKADSADQYAQSVKLPWYSIVSNLGLPVLIWATPLAIVGLLALRKRGVHAGVVFVCLAWIAGGVASVAIFNVGPDNFPISGVAVALLAGLGAASIPLPAVTIVLGLAAGLVMEVPPLLKVENITRLPGVLRTFASPGPINYLRVYWNPIAVESVLPVVDKVCADVGSDPVARCMVLATRGLFNPSWEDGGTFAFFLAGRPKVTVLTPELLWFDNGKPSGVAWRVHALVDVECAGHQAPSTGGRFQTQTAKMKALLETYKDSVIATYGDNRACVQTWYAVQPGGLLVQ
jgi:hypothetical protein